MFLFGKKLIRQVVIASIFVLIAICNTSSPIAAGVRGVQRSDTTNLSGRTFEYEYGDSAYTVEFLSDTQLRWRGIRGDDFGKSAEEACFIQGLPGNSYFVSWNESEGIHVQQVLDLDKKTVSSFLGTGLLIEAYVGAVREIGARKPVSLVGKRLRVVTGEAIHEIVFESDTQLNWTPVQGYEWSEIGKRSYLSQSLDDGVFFVSWADPNGAYFTEILNFG